MQDNHYTEFLEYCGSRDWEGHTFDFTVLIKNNNLIQTGIEKIPDLGIERAIIETYTRIK